MVGGRETGNARRSHKEDEAHQGMLENHDIRITVQIALFQLLVDVDVVCTYLRYL